LARDEPTEEEDHYLPKRRNNCSTPKGNRHPNTNAHKVVVTSEQSFVIVGVDARDRPGLLLDLSKGLLRLNLTLRHSEASVVGDRSISIWRCEVIGEDLPDLEEIWSVMNALLESFDQGNSQAVKRGGLRVIRAMVTPKSTLIGKTTNDVDFRNRYKAAIVAIQKGGRNVPLSGFVFGPGDVLVLQADSDSPLLKHPPGDFYRRTATDAGSTGNMSRSNSVNSFVKKLAKSFSAASLEIPPAAIDDHQQRHQGKISNATNLLQQNANGISDDFGAALDIEAPRSRRHSEDMSEDEIEFFIENEFGSDEQGENQVVVGTIQASMNAIISEEEIWRDLQVAFPAKDKHNAGEAPSREFLTAMEVALKSQLAGRTVAETGLDKLPGVFLVSIDRPAGEHSHLNKRQQNASLMKSIHSVASDGPSANPAAEVSEQASIKTSEPIFTTISPDMPLKEGDILWFAGGAQSVGDLRKIPGLMSYENEEVEKMNEKVHDRRLVEAVIARRGPLVGKTVKQVRFPRMKNLTSPI
jgi:uncharacterized protein with PhoU and TrkA domain